MRILTAAEMRAVDRAAIDDLGLPLAALMENAGRAVADAVLAAAASEAGGRPAVVIVCGRGNNGGDGLVAARHLANRGADPRVLLLGPVAKLRDPVVRAHAALLPAAGVTLLEAPDEAAFHAAWDRLAPGAEVVVDAVFGTGFTPPAGDLESRAIAAINEAGEAGAGVVAVDLPSGLDADRGSVLGAAVEADSTVALAALKPAHVLAPAALLCGDVVVADIGLPAFLLDRREHAIERLEAEDVAALLPPRPATAHKGSFGHLLVVAGSRGKTGAAILAARAALRAGAGLVTVATPEGCLLLVAAGSPELMTAGLPETAEGTLSRAALEPLRELIGRTTAAVIGPGLGRHPETKALVRELAGGAGRPMLLDADGLHALGSDLAAARAGAGVVLTPHPGEAATLLATTAAAVNEDRFAAARRLAGGGAVAVLKGQATVIAEPGGRLAVNAPGGPALATGGTGDVLAGIIGAFLAQGLAPAAAARLGVYLHGLAAGLVVEAVGGGEAGGDGGSQPALIASDLIEALPRAFRRLADGGGDDPRG